MGFLGENFIKIKVKKIYMEDKNNIMYGNVIIAQFMGWKIDNSFPDKGRIWRSAKSLELDTTLKFHKSWDELIPLIDKIDEHKKESVLYGSEDTGLTQNLD